MKESEKFILEKRAVSKDTIAKALYNRYKDVKSLNSGNRKQWLAGKRLQNKTHKQISSMGSDSTKALEGINKGTKKSLSGGLFNLKYNR